MLKLCLTLKSLKAGGPFGYAKFNKQTTDNLMFYLPFRPEFGLNDINAKKHSHILVS